MRPAVDKYQLLPELLKVRGLVKEHLDSFNYFVTTEIKRIVRDNDRIRFDDPKYYLRYDAPIYVRFEYSNNINTDGIVKKTAVIGRMPIMLKSWCCVLYGKDEHELANLGECPLDPGGYFVVKGEEKVLLIQEQLSRNRIIIERDNRGWRVLRKVIERIRRESERMVRLLECPSLPEIGDKDQLIESPMLDNGIEASVMSSTEMTNSKTVIRMEKEKLYLLFHSFTTKVPIMVVIKAMGMESDQEVVQMLGRNPCFGKLLLPSIQESHALGIYSRQQALDFLEKKLKNSRDKELGALGVLRDLLLAKIRVRENNFHSKCIYIAVMLRRMMDAILNNVASDDKDYLGNKRLKLSGQLMSLLFEHFEKYNITSGLENALFTGNWDIQWGMHWKGMSQVVNRMSFIGTVSSMTKIQSQFDKSRQVGGPRALHPSQWGMLCPCDTPEGESCGLVKNLTLGAHVTTDQEEGPIISLCYCLGVEDLELLSAEELHTPSSFLVILNGLIIGKHRRPQVFASCMRGLRRDGKLCQFLSIFVNEKECCVYIASDGGRVCRPLVIADKGVSRIKETHMKVLKDGFCDFDSFVQEGLLEYLDVNEQNNVLIALYEGEATNETTHIEIEPSMILGVSAGLIPFPHHNQSPRNTHQCAMGKQAMGNIAHNQVLDKMHARGVGPRELMTRQPTEGKRRHGGLRMGEMERDCLIAYGASMLLYERLTLSSDPFEAQVCRSCGLLGYKNYQSYTSVCSTCKDGSNISAVKLPYACKLLFQELMSMNIVPRLKLTEE